MKGPTAKLEEVARVIEEGGFVEFVWRDGLGEWLVSPDGARSRIDGRTYQGFLITIAPALVRTETGSTESKDLVIVWKKATD